MRSLARRGRWVWLVVLVCAILGGVVGWRLWGTATAGGSAAETRTRGWLLKRYADRAGKEHLCVVFVPYGYKPGQRRPLLVFLNGKGENGADGVNAVSNNFGVAVWEMKRTFPCVVVAPQCGLEQSWVGGELGKAMTIMDHVAEEYGTDPDRVYVTGVSAGGSGVWNAVAAYPGRFAAAVPVSGFASGDAKALAKSGLAIWAFYNEGDKEGIPDTNRAMRQALLEAGASPMMSEYPQEGHNAWNLAYRWAGMYEWLLEQSLSKNARRKPYKLLSADKMLSAWATDAGWKVEDGTITWAGTDAEPGCLVSPEAYRAGKFDVDVYLDADADECQLGLVETVDGAKGYTLHLTPADAGSGGLEHSTDGWIASLDPAAQCQLRRGTWNDVRLDFGEGRITARINGWKALDVPLPADRGPFHLALISPANSDIRWRNARFCEQD